jgi:catechol 2,3-dioxygenase-like lactoylglutathione lyase family enzyme
MSPMRTYIWLGMLLLPLLLWGVILMAQSATENPLGLKAHHITASVVDVDRAVKWYKEMLGFKLVERGSRQNGAFQFAEMTIPGFGVALVQIQGSVQPAPASTASQPLWRHIVFSVADPDRTFKLLKERGAKVSTRTPEGTPVKSFLVFDIDGNEIEILENEPAAAK